MSSEKFYFSLTNLYIFISFSCLTAFSRTSSIMLIRSIEREDILQFSSVQFSRSVLFDSLRPHELQHPRPPCPSPIPELNQTHVHQVSDAIQPSHPLSSLSPPAPNPSKHLNLFQGVNSSHEVAKVLEFQL